MMLCDPYSPVIVSSHYNILIVVTRLIYLAIGCGIFGTIVTFLLLLMIERFNVDISRNWWLVAIPMTLAVLVNVCLLELSRWFRNRHR